MQVECVKSAKIIKYPNRKYVAEIIKSFNTWRFKRSQPSDATLLETSVGTAVAAGRPIPFVLYWGKGFRAQSGKNERGCLDYLLEMEKRIEDVYEAGAHFDILYTDTHATLNGHRREEIDEYFKCLQVDCGVDFRIQRLSEVVSAAQVTDEDVSGVTIEEAREMISRLVGCAEKWYRGYGNAAHGAERYFWMNMVERLAVERIFPSSIFVTFNGVEMRPIFPERLPIFYMYSVKKGTSVKPWFMDEPDAAEAEDSTAPQALRA